MIYKTIAIVALILLVCPTIGNDIDHEFEYSSANNFVIGEIVELKPNTREVTVKNFETGKNHEYQIADDVFITVEGKRGLVQKRFSAKEV